MPACFHECLLTVPYRLSIPLITRLQFLCYSKCGSLFPEVNTFFSIEVVILRSRVFPSAQQDQIAQAICKF